MFGEFKDFAAFDFIIRKRNDTIAAKRHVDFREFLLHNRAIFGGHVVVSDDAFVVGAESAEWHGFDVMESEG